jgi:hypothetical protein
METSVYKPLKVRRPQFPPEDKRERWVLDLRKPWFGGDKESEKDTSTLTPAQIASEKANKS